MFGFGLKKLKLDRFNTVWLKKLSLTDFFDNEFVPLMAYSLETDEEKIRKNEKPDNELYRSLFEKAIYKVKGYISKEKLIEVVLQNEGVCNQLYACIFLHSCKKKILNSST